MSDLISRTELWNRLARVPISQYAVDERTMIHNVINEMPTAETTGELDDVIQEYIKSGLMEFDDFRPKGHWILSQSQDKEDTDNGNYRFECSNCGYSDTHSKATEVPYCWHCGADMNGERISDDE